MINPDDFRIDRFLDAALQELQVVIPDVVKLRSTRTIKSDQSFVTEGDLLINSTIRNLCARQALPITFVTEESAQHLPVLSHDVVLVLDPIDGTENFTSGLPEWGISISVFQYGRHLGSMIGCPELNLWVRSGEKLTPFFSRIRGLSSSLRREDLQNITPGHEYRITGCCVYNMINVIRGSFISFENHKGAHSWDILGGLNIALENHLNITVDDKPYSGEYLQADRKYRFRIWRE